jgi:hypothetical protein
MSSGGVIGILVDLRFMLLRRERRGESGGEMKRRDRRVLDRI